MKNISKYLLATACVATLSGCVEESYTTEYYAPYGPSPSTYYTDVTTEYHSYFSKPRRHHDRTNRPPMGGYYSSGSTGNTPTSGYYSSGSTGSTPSRGYYSNGSTGTPANQGSGYYSSGSTGTPSSPGSATGTSPGGGYYSTGSAAPTPASGNVDVRPPGVDKGGYNSSGSTADEKKPEETKAPESQNNPDNVSGYSSSGS